MISLPSRVAEPSGQNSMNAISITSIRHQLMFIMWAVIVILSTLSFLSIADIRPTGGTIEYIYTHDNFAFEVFIAINMFFAVIFNRRRFLIFVFIGLFLWMSINLPHSALFSDKVWVNIYINFDIAPCGNGQCKSLKQLGSSKDVAEACGSTAISWMTAPESKNLPIKEVCTYVSRRSERFLKSCDIGVLYINRENNNFSNGQDIFKSIAELALKTQEGEFNYYAPHDSGVFMYKTCSSNTFPR